MKVLHISTYNMGGAGIAATRIHKALLGKGIDSTFLCLYKESTNVPEVYGWGKGKAPSPLKRILRKFNLLKSRSQKNLELLSDYEGGYEMFSFPFTDYNILEHPLVQEADLIHLHWVSNFLDYESFFSKLNKPLVWTFHDLNPLLGGFHYESDINKNEHLKIVNAEIKRLKYKYLNNPEIAFVGVSNWTTSKIRDYLGSKVKSTTIYSPIDFSEFKNVSKSVAKEAIGIDSSKFIIGIGAQSFSNYRKGFWILLKALDFFSEEEKEGIQFVSFGGQSSKIEELRNLKCFNTINEPTFLSLVYSAMDCFVIPSVEEAFGLTGIEALSCGTPLIGSRTGGILDYLQEDINGVFFETENPEDLAKKIKLFISNSDLVKRLSKSARNSIIPRFNPEIVSLHYTRLYKETALL